MKIYKQTVNGIDHEFQLSDEDAKARGLTAKDVVEQDVREVSSPLYFDAATTDGQQTEAKRAEAARQAADADKQATTSAGRRAAEQTQTTPEGEKQADAPKNKAASAADK